MTDLKQLPDEKIVELVRSKDKEIYAEIIRRYQGKLLRYADHLSNNPDNAADIVQQSFIKAYINLNGFNVKKKFSSWIYRIAHNEAMNVIAKQKRQTPLFENSEFDSGINIEDDFIKRELSKHTHECLNQMPIIYKEPLTLYYLDDKDYEEISDILKIPIGTVGTRINRAKGIMKKICQKIK